MILKTTSTLVLHQVLYLLWSHSLSIRKNVAQSYTLVRSLKEAELIYAKSMMVQQSDHLTQQQEIINLVH